MRLRCLTALVICIVATFALAASPDDIPLAPAVEGTARAGLPNFYAKLEAGQVVRIAYLGGSITAQEGWRPKTLAYFQKYFPKAKILAQRKQKIDDPKRFNDSAFYPGALLLVGDLVE